MVQVNTPIVLRIKFKKVGSLQYISHLDLVRTMNKILVRAKLPLKYTEGFNPKPKMVFAAPLSIGTESVTEFMDVRLSEHIDESKAMTMLNSNMTDEMQAIEVYYPQSKLTDLKWLSYTVVIRTSGATSELAARMEEVLLANEVNIEKRTKSGEYKTVDIRPLIKSVDAVFDGTDIRMNAILSADASSFLNPEFLIKVLKRECAILSDECIVNEWYSIMRERAYRADMSEFR